MIGVFIWAILAVVIGACISPVFYFAAGAVILAQLFTKDKF